MINTDRNNLSNFGYLWIVIQLTKEHILSLYRHMRKFIECIYMEMVAGIILVIVLLFYVQGKHLRSCRDGQLT